MKEPPVFQPYPMRCRACGLEWEGKLLVHVPLADAAAYMRGLECPECHAGSEHLHIDAKPVKWVLRRCD